MSLKDVVQKKGYRQDKISLAITMLPFVILVLSMIYISSQNPYFFTVRNISVSYTHLNLPLYGRTACESVGI